VISASNGGSARGEGSPADIPVFEGYRVVLLGPPSYERTWQSQRMFANLPANLEITGRLSPEQVHAWLQRMAQAAAAAPEETPE
jgi:hypothetical protein